MLTPVGFSFLIGVALKSFFVLVGAYLLALLLHRSSAASRHLVWTGVFAALVALPFLSLSLPALRAPVSRNLLPDTVQFRTSAAHLETELKSKDGSRQSGGKQDVQWLPTWRDSLLFLWACGVAFNLAQLVVATARVTHARRQARRLNDPEFGLLARQLEIQSDVQLFQTTTGMMPMAIGLIRPAVLLPSDAAEWTDERRHVVLLHELAHLRRGDVLTNLFCRLALCFYWWNPLAWKAWRQLVKEREQAADDLVLGAGARPTAYAGHLLDIARTLSSPPVLGQVGLAMARSSDLEGRITAILDSRRHRGSAGQASAWLAALLAISLVSPLAALRGQEPKTALSPTDIDATISSAKTTNNFEKLDAAAQGAESQRQWAAAQKLLEVSLALRGVKSGQQSIDYGVGLSNLGDLARKQGHKDAAAWYTQAEALLGNHSEAASALTYLGIAAIGDKKYDQAISYLQRAETVETSSQSLTEIVLWMAIARDRQGMVDDADQLYRKAISQNHAYPNGSAIAADQQLYMNFLIREHRESEVPALTSQIESERKVLREENSKPLPEGVYQIGGSVSAPKVLAKVEPDYAEEARIAKYEGTLVMQVEIGTDGRAHNATVLQSLGLGLDDRALDAVSQWKFQPASKGAEPVPTSATIEVNFRLL